MADIHKKQEIKSEAQKTATPAETSSEPKTEPVVVSDVITETIEIEEVPVSQAPSVDPLSGFKEKMAEEEFSPLSNAPKKNYMWPILFIFIIAIVLLIGVFLYKQGVNTSGKVNVVTPSPSPSIAPEPTKTIDMTKYEIEILNGSGVEGEASRQKLSLTAEGFTISSVGNADNSNYTETIIKAKKDVEKAFLDKLKSVLGTTFTVGTAETLPDSSSVPVIVILGTKI